MTDYQQQLWAKIQAMKADPNHNKAALKRLVHLMTEDDDISGEIKARERFREGRKGGRNPAYGKWRRGDE